EKRLGAVGGVPAVGGAVVVVVDEEERGVGFTRADLGEHVVEKRPVRLVVQRQDDGGRHRARVEQATVCGEKGCVVESADEPFNAAACVGGGRRERASGACHAVGKVGVERGF